MRRRAGRGEVEGVARGERARLPGVQQRLLARELEREPGVARRARPASIPPAAATVSSVAMSSARSPVRPNALIVTHARGLCASTNAAYDATSGSDASAPAPPEHDGRRSRRRTARRRCPLEQAARSVAPPGVDDALPAVEHDRRAGSRASPSRSTRGRPRRCALAGSVTATTSAPSDHEQARGRGAGDAVAELEHPHAGEEVRARARVGHGAVASGTWVGVVGGDHRRATARGRQDHHGARVAGGRRRAGSRPARRWSRCSRPGRPRARRPR